MIDCGSKIAVLQCFFNLSLKFQIRKYFLIVLKFMDLYSSGETGNSVFAKMAEQPKKHRSGAIFGAAEPASKNYNRDRRFLI